jgi:FKBP-type peptidyl-prolyl cis-trans isomerase
MVSKYEAVGISVSVLFMALALYLIRVETNLLSTGSTTAPAAVVESSVVFVGGGENINQERANALLKASDGTSKLHKMVIEDVKIGTGDAVEKGNTVSVHYVGTLQDGYEFDNSNKRGEPFEFTVGEGRVIKGWEEGLIGMKVGGERILVIPPEMAYGKNGIGPIPPDSTLVFSISLLEIK